MRGISSKGGMRKTIGSGERKVAPSKLLAYGCQRSADAEVPGRFVRLLARFMKTMGLPIDREPGATEAPELSNSVLKSILVATLLPLGAYAVQLLLWPFVSPHVWLMLFPRC